MSCHDKRNYSLGNQKVTIEKTLFDVQLKVILFILQNGPLLRFHIDISIIGLWFLQALVTEYGNI